MKICLSKIHIQFQGYPLETTLAVLIILKQNDLKSGWVFLSQWASHDMATLCQHPSYRIVLKLSSIRILQSNAFFFACWVWVWYRRPGVRVRYGFEVCFVLAVYISKQLMILFRSPQKAKTALNHTIVKYLLYTYFFIIP